jgi:hypothetical protein
MILTTSTPPSGSVGAEKLAVSEKAVVGDTGFEPVTSTE